MSENENFGQQWGGVPPNQPGQPGQPTGSYGGAPYPTYGPPTQGGFTGPQPGPGQQYGQPPFGGPPAPPAAPSFLAALPLPIKLALGSAVAGVITFFMGFLSWVSISQDIDSRADEWASDQSGDVGIPAFLTMVFTPGFFLLGLGAAGVAAFGFVAVKWRRYLPHIAFLVIFSWLGLLACALALPSFIGLGAGAIIALILGAAQLALIGAAVVMDGLNDQR